MVPEEEVVPQVVVQEPPGSVDSTVTGVPAEIVVTSALPVDGPFRSRTPSHAAVIGVPARTGCGDGTEITPTRTRDATKPEAIRIQAA